MSNNNEQTSIHDFDFSLICEYFSATDRQEPGSEECTLRALGFLKGIDANTHIADLGSGTGSSALVLAQHTEAQITAIDIFPDFIEKLRLRAEEAEVEQRIHPLVGTMEALPFEEASFDVIWSEGAIYNIGFERGVREWKRFLKTDGYLAVTEASWLTDERPKEIENFWQDAYPEMDTVANKIAQLQANGYRLVAAFTLPDECWTKHYYLPQQEAQHRFLKKYQGNAFTESLVKNQRRKAELYAQYKDYYGYVFYIAQRKIIKFALEECKKHDVCIFRLGGLD